MNGFLELFAEYDILGAFWMNVRLTVLAALGSFVLGTVLAVFRISPVPSMQAIGTSYVNVVRNTPLTIIMVLG
ncbi:MAG TPA: ABC transporter permease subunit, partial [Citricoccus sp.]